MFYEGACVLAIFFWIMHNIFIVVPVRHGIPCYFLLNYAWQSLDHEPKGDWACYFLLNYARTYFPLAMFAVKQFILAIFFWIMRHLRGPQGAGGALVACYFLLNYAFNPLATGVTADPDLPCYFLLNYACIRVCSRYYSGLLSGTCYFLLNYAHVLHVGSYLVLDDPACYFLLNYAGLTGTADLVARNIFLAIFFWIMPMEPLLERLGELLEKHLAIFFWIMHYPTTPPVQLSNPLCQYYRFFAYVYYPTTPPVQIKVQGELAIFFWIMRRKRVNEGEGCNVHLLFSFELCTRNTMHTTSPQ